jgi:NADH-quinone oxidoreductase subunit M
VHFGSCVLLALAARSASRLADSGGARVVQLRSPDLAISGATFRLEPLLTVSLSVLIWLPLAISVFAALMPARLVRPVAAVGSLAPLAVAIYFMTRFDSGRAGLQFVTDKVWIGALGIHYKLAIDGLNISLILLTAVLFTVSLFWSAGRELERTRLYYFWFGLAESAVLGAFCAQDLMLFVAFFDLMLIPFYFLVGQWGGTDRVRATIKLVIYTMVGSFLMLAAAIATGVIGAGSLGGHINFTFTALSHVHLSHSSQDWLFLCFAAAFLVKMPLAPLHGWLRDAYKAMPIPVVAVFSGILSKVAAYGFLRIVLPLFPYASRHYQLLMLLICLFTIVWATAVAFTVRDARLVVAYSSVAQLAFITLGVFSLRPDGAQGALLQMVNHGLVTAGGFFVVGTLAARCGGSERLEDMGGVAFRAPVLAALFLIIALATLAMPGSSNFIGEFMILLGVFQSKMVIAVLAFLGVVGASFYALRLFIRSMHNRVGAGVGSREVLGTEAVALVPLVLIILALAFFPQFGLSRSQRSVKATVAATSGLPNVTVALVPAKGGTP